MKPARILAGRRESELLALPSVQLMTDILAKRCREPSWIRTSVASLERFRSFTGLRNLEELCAQAKEDKYVAESALQDFALSLRGYGPAQISALAMGPKIWFRLNGVEVSWRPLADEPAIIPSGLLTQDRSEQFILLALIGSGLRLAELLRLQLKDVGSLNAEGQIIPDLHADPLAVQHVPHLGKQGEKITFLTFQARQALLASQPKQPETPLPMETPLVSLSHGSMSLRQAILRARRRSQALITAGSNVNVALCRATGDFFRSWGLPGSHFEGEDELQIEEYF